MHCPRCGQQQISDEIRFCAKCGFELSDVRKLLAPEFTDRKSKRKSEINKAKKQGFGLMLFGLVVILILAILRDFIYIPKSVFLATMLILMVGGMIRMVSPYFFGGNKPAENRDDSINNELHTTKSSGENFSDKSLPEAEYRPPINFGKQTYDTNELVSTPSVTENTTRKLRKHLEKE